MDRKPTNSSRPEVIDLISIVFESELILLQIQAKSIDLYIDPDRIASIFIIVNDNDNVVSMINKDWWGRHADKVLVIPRSQVGTYSFLDGWSSQQLYKLAAAAMAKSPWTMCLDSKTWFVQNLNWDHLFDNQGRARFENKPVMPVFLKAKAFAENFFQTKFDKMIGPAGVPFLFHTETILGMMKQSEKLSNNHFLDWFATKLAKPLQITEFIFYSAYAFSIGANTLYSDSQYYRITNLADWQLTDFDEIIKYMQYKNNLTASIQGRAYSHLSDDQLDKWLDFLLNKQLITDKENTKILLNTLR